MSIQPNYPIVNKGELYVNGLGISWVDGTHITIAAGQARDSTDINDISLSASVTINTRVSAVANGIDVGNTTGNIVINTLYYVFVIGDSNSVQPTAGLLSLSATAPLLPFGYDMFRRVGAVKSDNTAAPGCLILKFAQAGNGSSRWMYYSKPINVLPSNNTHAAEYTDVDCSASVPAGYSRQLAIDVDFAANAAADVVLLEVGPHVAGDIAAGYQQVEIIAAVAGATAHTRLPVTLPCGSTSMIAFQNAAGALVLNLNGYVDQL